MKFKTGDRVKIVSLDMTRKFFGVNKFKENLLGKTAIIQNITKSYSYPDIYRHIINSCFFHEDDLQLITTDLEIE